MTDPYSVLGITPSADDETIKKAYRKKCKEYHPDLHPDDPSAEEHFKEVQAAYSEIMRIKQGGGASYISVFFYACVRHESLQVRLLRLCRPSVYLQKGRHKEISFKDQRSPA